MYYLTKYHFAVFTQPQVKFEWLKPTLTIEDKDIKVLANNAIERKVISAQYDRVKKALDDADIAFDEILHCQNNERYQEIVLKGRSFKGLSLEEVVICNVNLKAAQLQFAKISDSTFSGRFDEVKFNYAVLNDVRFQMNSAFEDAEFVGVHATKFRGNQIGFIAADFREAYFIEGQLNQSRFNRSNMAKVEFANSKLNGAKFYGVEQFNASVGLATAEVTGCVIEAAAITDDEVKFAQCDVLNWEKLAVTGQENNPELQEKAQNQAPTNKTDTHHFSQEVLDKITAARVNNATEIDLSKQNLSQLPSELLALRQLRIVDLSGNQLDHQQIRLLINSMPNLEVLDLSSNQLTQIPAEIKQLKNLTFLDISSNPLEQAITQIERLSALTELEVLDLNNLSLNNLPSSFSTLKKLRILGLSYNQFTQVPMLVWQLTTLERLYLDNNKLTELPAEIGQLQGLDVLWIQNNQLKTLPRELADLSLTWFKVGGNQLAYPPQDVADKASGPYNFQILKQWFAENPGK